MEGAASFLPNTAIPVLFYTVPDGTYDMPDFFSVVVLVVSRPPNRGSSIAGKAA